MNILTNGDIAVQFFFVCSGILIAKHMYSLESFDLKYFIKKYKSILRLVIPGLIFPFILMKLNLMFHLKASGININLSFVNDYNTFNPNLLNLVIDFFATLFHGSSYNGPLWTIRYQLIGTLLISVVSFLICKYSKSRSERKWAYLAISIPSCFVNLNIAGFFFGAIIYELYDSLDSDSSPLGLFVAKINNNRMLKAMVFIIGVYCACINCGPLAGIYSWLKPLAKIAKLIRAFGVSVMLFIILCSARLQNVVDNKWMRYLGKISPYIYIFHWPILLSLGCGLYLYLYSKVSYNVLTALILISCTIVTICISVLYIQIGSLMKGTIHNYHLNKK